ncbi:hypothetical protein Mterra_03920 [Calidithermus terrae]|uniref:Uncharacterized protein n=1 Tax=Calidithermus terrae TaxID=1408545 RepID=A0A399E1A0_9DEIN|nr:hypothetical protein [Calidithermus terrae]RIH76011.1 hypothetical protein Mterra_03920 [Calidithermus terrae]
MARRLSPSDPLEPGKQYEFAYAVKRGDPFALGKKGLEEHLNREFRTTLIRVDDWGRRDGLFVVRFHVEAPRAQAQGSPQPALVPALAIVVGALAAATVAYFAFRVALEFREALEVVGPGPIQTVGTGAAVGMGGLGVFLALLGLSLLWPKRQREETELHTPFGRYRRRRERSGPGVSRG